MSNRLQTSNTNNTPNRNPLSYKPLVLGSSGLSRGSVSDCEALRAYFFLLDLRYLHSVLWNEQDRRCACEHCRMYKTHVFLSSEFKVSRLKKTHYIFKFLQIPSDIQHHAYYEPGVLLGVLATIASASRVGEDTRISLLPRQHTDLGSCPCTHTRRCGCGNGSWCHVSLWSMV